MSGATVVRKINVRGREYVSQSLVAAMSQTYTTKSIVREYLDVKCLYFMEKRISTVGYKTAKGDRHTKPKVSLRLYIG